MKHKERQSNIELLRILAMLMIIDVHYFAACNAGAHVITGSGNWLVFQIMESLGICGVDLFILFTGYFSLRQDSIKIRKIVDLLVQVAFWGGLGFLLCMIADWKPFDLKALIKIMFPLLFGGRWFVKAYIVLLCLIPFINRALRSISRKSYQIILAIFALLFSIWPSFLPSPPLDDYGYGFVHFVFMYLIGGYLQMFGTKLPRKGLCLAGYVVSAGIVTASSMLGQGYHWAYNYVFVITEAVSLFMLFVQIKLHAGWINSLATCAFGVFLIHTDGFFSVLVYERMLHCTELMAGSPLLFLGSALCSMPVFYLIGFILESIRKKAFSVTVDCMLDHIPVLNRAIVFKNAENHDEKMAYSDL